MRNNYRIPIFASMQLQIIHLKERKDRAQLLEQQLLEQHITNYKIWKGIEDHENPKRGIAKAHKQIIKWASDQNLPSILIAEDDIKFTAKKAFEYFIKNEPNDFDLYLGGITHGKINTDNSVTDFAGTHFYKIYQKFYNTFLSLPEDKDIDRALAHKGKFIVCNPFIVIQQNGFSDNQRKYQNYELYIRDRQLFK
jgi:GR25 family glycosyltransferase involved in LPS biosynthesis